MIKFQAAERNGLIVLIILCFIVVLYGAATFQWGLVFSLIWFLVVIVMVLIILKKFSDYIRSFGKLNRQMASDLRSLKNSVDGMREETGEIKALTESIAKK
ncbi:acriflavin resistance protein [Methanolacinia petrolearia DSM 11571]|uniref:Acriflavin resistance protein n=1 Tax=Methanolacinia petrolearia (strain DSM 11571 / OCM 486 / SEBR 4847) TaxID=679926 RepID=E1RIZ6_METP4|nr:acriflavin resistance protein [Methanolacinia petrolearia]ADN35584.1 acriflavin resistance protein [Methanolacinia petrolearia DSM 11571]